MTIAYSLLQSDNDDLDDGCITNDVADTIITMLFVSHILEILESQKCLVLLGMITDRVKKQVCSCEFPI